MAGAERDQRNRVESADCTSTVGGTRAAQITLRSVRCISAIRIL